MFRTLSKSKMGFVLAILFGISLFFFRSGSRTSNLFNSDSIIAKVSGTTISTNKFLRTIEMNIENFNQMIGKQMTGDEIRSFQIHTLAIGALINEAIFENEFDKINFIIDEKVIALKTKERLPKLYNSNNQINDLYLKSFLKQQQLKIEDIVQIINYETRNEFFNKSFFEINYPSYFSKRIDKIDNHKRKISYTEIDITNIFNKEIEKEYSLTLESELKKYYENNISNYMSSEQRSIEYFKIDKKELRENFIPSEFEIQTYYDINKILFFQDEKRSFVQFNFKNDTEAYKFKSTTQNMNLEQTIEFAIKNEIKYNEFNKLKYTQILEEISKPLFKLNVNEISEIITTSIAKHIIILKSIESPYQETLENVKNNIIEIIADIDTEDYFKEIVNQIAERVLEGKNIKKIAKEFDLKIKFIENIDRNYDDYNQSDSLFYKDLIGSAFITNKDFVSDVKNLDTNISYVFNVNNIILSKPIIFKKIKSNVERDWETSIKVKKMQDIIEKNQNKKTFINNFSTNRNLTLKEIVISNNSDQIPFSLLKNSFNAEKNESFFNFYEGKFYVARIDDIIISEISDKENTISINDDLRSSFGNELMKIKKIETNDILISAIIERY